MSASVWRNVNPYTTHWQQECETVWLLSVEKRLVVPQRVKTQKFNPNQLPHPWVYTRKNQ